jgi:hypothetical protein
MAVRDGTHHWAAPAIHVGTRTVPVYKTESHIWHLYGMRLHSLSIYYRIAPRCAKTEPKDPATSGTAAGLFCYLFAFRFLCESQYSYCDFGRNCFVPNPLWSAQRFLLYIYIYIIFVKSACKIGLSPNLTVTSRAGHSLLFTLFANRYSATSMYHFAIATPLGTFLNFAIRYSLFATSFDKSDGLYNSRLF